MLINKDKYFFEFLNRTIPLLTEAGVNKLKDSTVAIAGCGGSGGACAITLARMGVGNFKLADPGIFDEPDINRQWAANIRSLGKKKTDCYMKMLRDINPGIGVKKYSDGVTDENVVDFLDGADLVVDCLDVVVSSELRARMYRQAKDNGIYSMTAPILSFGSIFCCAAPDGMGMERVVSTIDEGSNEAKFPAIFRMIFMPQHLDIIESKIQTHRIPSVAISPMVAAAMLSTEAVLALAGDKIPGGRKPLCLPKVIAIDFFRLTHYVVDINHVLG
ncbi:ThiF family adenylyltransferase [Candidatus Omnitrophota bacterium]